MTEAASLNRYQLAELGALLAEPARAAMLLALMDGRARPAGELARAAGVPKVLVCKNGDQVRLAPGDPSIVGEVPSGKLYKDGALLEDAKSRAVVERRKMGFSGCAFVALAVTETGELADDPEVELVGIPEKNAAGELLDDIAYDAVLSTVETLPRARRRDPDAMAESVRRAVRSTLAEQWGKKPLCFVHVLVV